MACSPYKWLISGRFLLYKWGLQITNYTKWDPILQVGLLLQVTSSGVIMFILYWSNNPTYKVGPLLVISGVITSISRVK